MHVHAASSGPVARRTTSVLGFSLAATLAYVLVTFIAGLRAHSLALLSESGHNVSDFLALLLRFAAVDFQSRPADNGRRLGDHGPGAAAGRAGRFRQCGYADWHFAVDWGRGCSQALEPGSGAAPLDDDCGCRRR